MSVFFGPAKVLDNREVAAQTFLLRLSAPALAAAGAPGQFVMVRTGPPPEAGGPLLKRPFSLHRLVGGEEVWLLYRVVGVGTGLLAHVRSGEFLEVLGPLGRGFELGADLPRALLVAGGIGLAPLPALAESLSGRSELTLFYGARTQADLVPAAHLDFFSGRVVLTTEDGTAGRQGLVTDPLAEALAEDPAPVFACGPRAFLAEVAALAEKAGVPAQVSLEARLACGLGACLGCVVQVAADQGRGPAYARVCADGPVFAAREVIW